MIANNLRENIERLITQLPEASLEHLVRAGVIVDDLAELERSIADLRLAIRKQWEGRL